MSNHQDKQKLAQVKRALAARYERLALVTGSRPRRKRLVHHADSYRRQAVELLRG